MKIRVLPVLLLMPFLFSCQEKEPSKENPSTNVALDSLREKINTIISSKHARVGVAIVGLEDHDTLTIRGNEQFTMMSVVKFPQALAILRRVDEGKLTLEQTLHFTGEDMKQHTYSPMHDVYNGQSASLTLAQTIKYAVGSSDNIACDKLFTLWSPRQTEMSIHSMGCKNMGIGTDYANITDSTLSKNWSTPFAMVQLLEKFYGHDLLSDTSRSFLWKLMVETQNPADRIKGKLPPSAVVAHKTGTMSRVNGVVPAFNDVGIVTLPNGKHFAIVVFVNDSKEGDEANASIIADISKAAWDYFSRK